MNIMDTLFRYATQHPDPATGELSISKSQGSDHIVEPEACTSSSSCVRGCAVNAIARLLWQKKPILDEYESQIHAIMADESLPVRLAAIGICIPLLNTDGDLAVTLFCTAISTEDHRILGGPHASRFISYAIHEHSQALIPVIERMSRSSLASAAIDGAYFATRVCFPKGQCHQLMADCSMGNRYQRQGVARATVQLISEAKHPDSCKELLLRFFDDDHIDVRGQAQDVFCNEEILERDDIIELAEAFVNTKAFDDGTHALFFLLDSFRVALKPYATALLRSSEKYSTQLAEDSRNPTTHNFGNAGDLMKLMLRLYQQLQGSQDRHLQEKCLDAWDNMIRSRVGGLLGVLREIDD